MTHPSGHRRSETTYTAAELGGSLGISVDLVRAAAKAGRLEGVNMGGGHVAFTQPAIGRWLDLLAADLEVCLLGGPAQIARCWQESPSAVRNRVRPSAVQTAMGTLTKAVVYWGEGLGDDGNPWEQPAIPMGEPPQAEV